MKIVIAQGHDDLRAFVGNLPEEFARSGRVLFSGRNEIRAYIVDTPHGPTEVVVKRYKRPNVMQKLVYSFFRGTKARHAYRNAGELLRRGFSTPEPLAYIETRRGLLADYCYFVSAPDYSSPVSGPLNEQTAYDRVMATDYALFVSRLHKSGVLDIDLNSGNVLYRRQQDGHYTFSLIDINRMRFYPDGQCVPRDACLENITRFTGRMDVFTHVARIYVEAMDRPDITLPLMLRVKVRHDERWEKKKRLLHPMRSRRQGK